MGGCTSAKTGSSETGWGIQHGVMLASDAGYASKTGGLPTCSGAGSSRTGEQAKLPALHKGKALDKSMLCSRANALHKGKAMEGTRKYFGKENACSRVLQHLWHSSLACASSSC